MFFSGVIIVRAMAPASKLILTPHLANESAFHGRGSVESEDCSAVTDEPLYATLHTISQTAETEAPAKTHMALGTALIEARFR